MNCACAQTPAAPGAGETSEALEERLRELELFDHALAIAHCWHITVHDLIHSRRTPAPFARQAFYCHLRDLGWSYPRIGALVGRDHSSIITACRAHAR